MHDIADRAYCETSLLQLIHVIQPHRDMTNTRAFPPKRAP